MRKFDKLRKFSAVLEWLTTAYLKYIDFNSVRDYGAGTLATAVQSISYQEMNLIETFWPSASVKTFWNLSVFCGKTVDKVFNSANIMLSPEVNSGKHIDF